ncbi:baeRF6 domain-containing protein [Streptococcus catagoni]|uniref:baeRF6 domain-containing protein n=1 Tax=Streptococcus catagoni TaxID=2654874 RepID=UPI001409255C|nr:hypothetical protein [Streptococcus catagoni]
MQQLNTFPHPELLVDDQDYITIAIDLDDLSAYSEKDVLLLENNLKEARQSTKDKGSGWEEQISSVRKDARLLLTGTSSLIIYITEKESYYYHIDTAVVNTIMFGPEPYLKPLIEHFQFANDYHLLVLDQDRARIFELGMDRFKEIRDGEWPIHLTEALGEEKNGGELSYGSFSGQGGDGQHGFHGHNETSSEKEIDRDNFFRYVDNYLMTYLGQDCETSLILYALKENQAAYRAISKYNPLLEEGIALSAAKVKDEEIAKQGQDFIAELKEKRLGALINRFKETSPEFRVDDNIEEIKTLALENRIEELLIVKNMQDEYQITKANTESAKIEKALKEIVLALLKASGKVYILNEDQVSQGLMISARLRY